jgi:glycosyltransferase 2 family protein
MRTCERTLALHTVYGLRISPCRASGAQGKPTAASVISPCFARLYAKIGVGNPKCAKKTAAAAVAGLKETEGGVADESPNLGVQRLRKGLFVFVLLSLGGLSILFFTTDKAQALQAFGHLNIKFLAAAVFFFALDMLSGGLRNHILLRHLHPNVTYWLSFRANLANLFGAAMTPAQTGGAPAQVYILSRGGIPVSEAVTVTAINFLANLIIFLIGAGFGFLVIRGRFDGNVISYLLEYSMVVFGIVFVLILVGLWRPDLLESPARVITRLLARIRPRWEDKMEAAYHRIVEELYRLRDVIRRFVVKNPRYLFYSVGANGLLYWSRFTMAYFLMRGMNVEAAYSDVLAIQAVLMFITYFAPTPGGSGIAEVTTGALMSILMPSFLLPLFTVMNRFFIMYFPAFVGSFILMKELTLGGHEEDVTRDET